MELIRQVQQEHHIQGAIVVIERTGNYNLPPKHTFAKAGFETRVVHPFATKQYRMPANPGNKTDETDLHAQHRAAVAGFGLCEFELDSPYRELQLRARHWRKLVEKAASPANQIREHLHLSMPGCAGLFDHLLLNKSALALARRCESPAMVIKLGRSKLGQQMRITEVGLVGRLFQPVDVPWMSQLHE
jgi:transposase